MSYLSEDHVTDDCMLRKLDGTAIKGRTKRLYKDLIANRITISRRITRQNQKGGDLRQTQRQLIARDRSSDRSVLAMQTMGTF